MRPIDSENLVAQAASKIDPYITKIYCKELQNDLTKIFVVFVVATWCLRYLNRRNIDSQFLFT